MEVELHKKFNIKNLTAFKVGGEIDYVYFPENIEQFSAIDGNYKVFGNLSNTLISTFGYSGSVVITNKMNRIDIRDNKVIAGCGVKGPMLAKTVAEKGLSGLEFMIGFPGSVGGEIFMNASANGQAISDCVSAVTLYSKENGLFKFDKSQMHFEYRNSICQKEDCSVLEVEFELKSADKIEILNKMNENLNFRKNHQPSLALPNCGSIFKNPKDNSAGKLLEEAGVKGLKVGGAKVWENHANFIVNEEKKATSADILNLMCIMKNKVKENCGIDLYPEILYLGNKNEDEEKLCEMLYKK